ncbi:hypothetical protein ACFL5V_08950 [Fibrobacterota bacterium]
MKIRDTQIISSRRERVWEVLTGFPDYPAWNNFIQSINGSPKVGSPLEICLKYNGPKIKRSFVSGAVHPKYFSFSAISGLGSWWYQAEHVFRLTSRDKDQVEFVYEIFCHGLSLKFSNKKQNSSLRRGITVMKLALKQRCEQVEQSPGKG